MMIHHFYFRLEMPIVVVLFCMIVSKGKANIYFEASSLLRSKSLEYHESSSHFLQLSEDYAYEMKKSVPHSRSASYLVKLPTHCDHICHEKITNRFGQDNYDIISSEMGIVTTTLTNLQHFYQNTFLVTSKFKATAKHGYLHDYAPLYPAMKIDYGLRQWMNQESCQLTMKSSVRILFIVHGLTTEEYLQFRESVLSFLDLYPTLQLHMGFETENRFIPMKRFHGMMILQDCKLVERVVHFLSMQPPIHWIERDYPIQLLNHWANGVCDTGLAGKTFFDQWNISGEGEVIGISDSGLDMKHCQFHDPDHDTPYNIINVNHRKVITYLTYSDRFEDNDGHGTHVSGTAAGYCNASDQNHGLAPQAKIAFADLGRVDDPDNLYIPSSGLYSMFTQLYRSGARIMTNSWGSQTGYSFHSYLTDRFLWDSPDVIILFAAGNAGYSCDEYCILSPGNSKSVLTVGSSLNDRAAWIDYFDNTNINHNFGIDAMSWFSSRGPTDDGRLKPDILAPGDKVFSAKGQNSGNFRCDFQWLQGTSMATPAVAGVIAKVRQYYRTGYYPTGMIKEADRFTPSGALLKATVIHSGQEISKIMDTFNAFGNNYKIINFTTENITYPSIYQGYGRIQLNTVLNISTSTIKKLFVIGGATSNDLHYATLSSTGSYHTYTFQTSNQMSQLPLRVTFVYTDSPGSYTTIVSLRNLLTLSITQGNHTYHPLLSQSTSDYSVSKSNVQVIDIPSPTPSTNYTVKILAERILQSPQPIALVVTGDMTHVASYWSEDPANNPNNNSDDDKVAGTVLSLVWLLIAVLVPTVAVLFVIIGLVIYCCRSRTSPSYSNVNRHQEQPVTAVEVSIVDTNSRTNL